MIVEDLAALAVPITRLSALPGNPRRGDVEAIAKSLAKFGQRKPVVARRDGTVTAGNHTLLAARDVLGWPELAVVWTDDDDATANAFALADNRVAELGGYDNADLLALIEDVRGADAELLAGLYSDADIDELMRAIGRDAGIPAGTPDDEWAAMPDFDQPSRQSAFHCTVHFASEDDAAQFFARLAVPRASSLWWPQHDGHKGSDVRSAYVADA